MSAVDEDDLVAVCEQYIKPDSFRRPTAYERDTLGACNYCFEDEVDVPEANLLVSDGSCGSRRVLHRDTDTGPLDYDYPSNPGPQLSSILQSEDVTDPSDDRVQDALSDGGTERGGDV